MKRYILYIFTIIVMGHLAVMAVLGYRYWVVRDLSDLDSFISQITLFQEQKIDSLQPGTIDTVFLGDSALGNALNAKRFDKIAGTKSLNLALTGSHGHASALVFLRKLLAREPQLKNVILFFAVDGMAWGTNKEGRFYMSPNPIEPAFSATEQLSLGMTYLKKLTEGMEAFSFAKKVAAGQYAITLPPSISEHDYIIRGGKVSAQSEDVHKYHVPATVAPKSTRYLNAIGILCQQHQLRCIYVQGPIMAEVLRGTHEETRFFSEVASAVNATSITLANEKPFTMSEKDRGDSIFHLSLEARDAWTTRYAKLLTPLLKQSQ